MKAQWWKKNRKYFSAALVGLFIFPAGTAGASPDVALLVNALVEKGVLTTIEAQSILEKAEEQKIKKGEIKTEWKNGLNFSTHDGQHTMKIGGRLHADAAWMRSDGALDSNFGQALDSTRFRRARIAMDGTIYNDLIYKIEFDFGGGDASFRDVYMGWKNIPYLGTLKAGNFKEPFSLDELTSSNSITFMERALPNAFAPSRNLGVALSSDLLDKRMTWAAGVFRATDGQGRTTANEHNFAARVTGLPWYEDGGRRLLHLGAAYRLNTVAETLRYSSRPEASMAPNYVDTGNFGANHASLLGLEAALVHGPFSLQGELIQSFVDRTGGSSAYFPGFYVQGSYLLTGEHRRYSTSSGRFSSPRPNNNFSMKDKTFGAWELAARYSHLDLSDKDINGGAMNDLTFGLNWYLNPNMRVMLNYVHANRNGVGSFDTVQTRFQTNF